ncbi:hypothetical protein [Sulfurovum sp.]|uniref:hypothetical protein n=1 Tax=Sulfurovum sp. TaxID=1969726 RepID=UPI00356A6DF9
MQKIIEKSTLINQQDQTFLLRHFARLPLERQLDILSRHRKILFMRKKQNPTEDVPINIVSFIAFVLAIKSHFADEKKLTTKRFEDMELSEVRELSMINLSKLKTRNNRKRSKRDRLLTLWAVVKTLKQEQTSFRDIARYLKRHHSLEVGHSLIHAMWHELENRAKDKFNA